MTRHEILSHNWLTELGYRIQDADPGDTIVCRTEEMAEIGKRGAKRLGKELQFEVPHVHSQDVRGGTMGFAYFNKK